MSQALLMSINENETPDNQGLVNDDFDIIETSLSSKFIAYLNVMKNCGIEGKCFYNKDIYFLNGTKQTNFYNPQSWGQMTFILSDGSFVAMNIISSDCSSIRATSKNLQNVCAFLYVDVNGETQPNVFGK